MQTAITFHLNPYFKFTSNDTWKYVIWNLMNLRNINLNSPRRYRPFKEKQSKKKNIFFKKNCPVSFNRFFYTLVQHIGQIYHISINISTRDKTLLPLGHCLIIDTAHVLKQHIRHLLCFLISLSWFFQNDSNYSIIRNTSFGHYSWLVTRQLVVKEGAQKREMESFLEAKN